MSSHGGYSHTDCGLACVSAFSLETANELSWMLGERVTADDQTTLLGEWQSDDTRQSISLFEATTETAIVRYRSPVGRDHYVGTTLSDAERVRADLDASAVWHRAEK
jgi:hypothetical protein